MKKYEKTLEELLLHPRMGINTGLDDINSIGGLIDLINHIGGLENKIMCEIGCYIGISTETFLQFNPKKLYAVDIWGLNDAYADCDWIPGGRPNFNIAENTFREMAKSYNNIEIIKNYSVHASFGFRNRFLDLVYIDGEHTYEAVSVDLQSWLPKIKSGGFISGHDINQPNVSRAIMESFSEHSVLVFKDSSWLVKIL